MAVATTIHAHGPRKDTLKTDKAWLWEFTKFSSYCASEDVHCIFVPIYALNEQKFSIAVELAMLCSKVQRCSCRIRCR
eukprot:4574460-Pleurochrysis_carterae.AAC.3